MRLLFAWSETMRNQGCSADQASFFLGRFVTAQRFLGELFAADPRNTRTSRFRPMLRVDKRVLEPNEYASHFRQSSEELALQHSARVPQHRHAARRWDRLFA